MKFLSTLLSKALQHKLILAGIGIMLASLSALPRLVCQRFGLKRMKQPREEDPAVTQTSSQQGVDPQPASLQPSSKTSSPWPQMRPLRTVTSIAMNHRLTLVVAILLLALGAAMVRFYQGQAPETVYLIAYIGRYQTKGYDELNELALRRVISSELNGRWPGVRFELKVFKTEAANDYNDSRKAYEEISADGRFIVVVDNTWGSGLKSVADIIRNRKIPVIATNGDKQDVDYGLNVVFVGNDDKVPEKVTRFCAHILKNSEAVFITEKKYGLTARFNEEFKKYPTKIIPLEVTSSVPNDGDKVRVLKELDSLLNAKAASREKLTVILNLHSKWGDIIIDHINQSSVPVTILGGPYITNRKLDVIGLKNDKTLIKLTYPRDAISNRVRHYAEKIQKEYPEVFKELDTQLFIKRCLDAASIIQKIIDYHAARHTAISREGFIKFFQEKLINQYITRQDKLYSFNELYSFDRDLVLIDERIFEQYSQGGVSPYPLQLNASGVVVPNITFGLEITNIPNIDIKRRVYRADFLLWFQYPALKDDYARDLKDIQDYMLFKNGTNIVARELFPNRSASDEMVHRFYKITGEFFATNVDLKSYPLDTQELNIELQMINPSEDLLISFDRQSLNRNALNIDEWAMQNVQVTIDNYITKSLWRGYSLEDKRPRKFKVLNVRMPVSQQLAAPLLTIIFPLGIIGLAAVALLFVRDDSFSNIGEVCVGLFLTIVTYSIVFAQITPRLNVMTIADKLFYATFLTVFFVFLKIIIFNSNLVGDSFRSLANARANHIGSISLLGYVLLMTGILFQLI